MSARTAFNTVLVGFLVAAVLFGWSEFQAGRVAGVFPYIPGFVTPTSSMPTPTVAQRAAALPSATSIAPAVTAAASSPTPGLRATIDAPVVPRKDSIVSISTSTSTAIEASATPRPAVATTIPPSPAKASDDTFRADLIVMRADLEEEIKTAVAGSGFGLRDPGVRLMTPDRIVLTAGLPLAIFVIPIELEARVFVDEKGAVRVQTTRVDAINASLPAGIAATLSQQVDEQGGRVISAALPPGAKARRVAVLSDRVQVELATR